MSKRQSIKPLFKGNHFFSFLGRHWS